MNNLLMKKTVKKAARKRKVDGSSPILDPARRSAAFHQAGHSISAYELETAYTRSLTLNTDGDLAPRIWGDQVGPNSHRLRWSRVQWPAEPEAEERVRIAGARASAMVAGYVAEAAVADLDPMPFTRAVDDQDPEWLYVHALWAWALQETPFDRASVHDYSPPVRRRVARTVRETEALLRTHWHAVALIAEALATRGTLTGFEIFDLLRKAHRARRRVSGA
jgi:hypothetical protein